MQAKPLYAESNVPFFPANPALKSANKKIDMAILSAMPEEMEYIETFFQKYPFEIYKIEEFEFKVYDYNHRKILLGFTGLGTTFATLVLTSIYQNFRPEYLLFLGSAGGINPELQIGDIVIAEEAFEAEIQDVFTEVKDTPFESCLTHPLNKGRFPSSYAADQEILDIASSIDLTSFSVHKGTVVSSNTFPAPKELFNKIKSRNPLCIDMETSALYQSKWLFKGMRILAIRAITNRLKHNGTDDKVHESNIKASMEAASKCVLKLMDAIFLVMNKNQKPNLEMKSDKLACQEDKEARELIQLLHLKPHPEGGHYAQIFKSSNKVLSTDPTRYNNEPRSEGTSIYYLLRKEEFSAWHKLNSVEIWNASLGGFIKIHVLDKQGNLLTYLLGNPIKNPKALLQVVIPNDCWFCAVLEDETQSYSLVVCTVMPGFEFQDFELADRQELCNTFPQHKEIIKKFTREVSVQAEIENSLGFNRSH